MHSCVSFVSFKNPSELQSILLASRYVKIMSVVSLNNLKSDTEYCIDCDTNY